MTNHSVVLPATRVINDPDFFVDLLKLAPTSIILYIQEPHDLAAIDILNKKNIRNIPVLPMLQFLKYKPEFIGNFVGQLVETLHFDQLYLMVHNTEENHTKLIAEIFHALQKHIPTNRPITINVCSSASAFFDRKSNAHFTLQTIDGYPQCRSRIAVMLSDSSNCKNLPGTNEFKDLLQTNPVFLLMKPTHEEWDVTFLETLEALNVPIIWFDLKSFLQKVLKEDPYPQEVLALATSKTDRVSIWSSTDNDRKPLAKRKQGEEEWIIKFVDMPGESWAELYDGGFINLKYFNVERLRR